MTPPGDSVVLIVLLAVFLACSGYAAGRLHQRYQLAKDREEAYRDGYDTATRSVFSLAARVIAPRRGGRGAARSDASVSSASAAGALPSALDGAPVSASMPRVSPGPVPTPAGESSVSPEMPRVSPGPVARPAEPGSAEEPASLGFPAPPMPSPRVVGEPAAVGGVVYQPFPDPRREEPVAAGPATDASASAPPVPAPAFAEPAGEGRHTVPDELVQAATYRLPPDRVFRAKVRDATLPEEPTTRLSSSVPKPRQS